MINNGTILITLDGASLVETERCRRIVHALFEEGFFSTRSGSFTAHFDDAGNYVSSERRIVRKVNKPIVTDLALESFRVETSQPDGSDVVLRR